MSGKTLSEKVWERHVVRSGDGLPDLLYIDLHLCLLYHRTKQIFSMNPDTIRSYTLFY